MPHTGEGVIQFVRAADSLFACSQYSMEHGVNSMLRPEFTSHASDQSCDSTLIPLPSPICPLPSPAPIAHDATGNQPKMHSI